MALSLESIKTLTEQYQIYLSSSPQVGFINVSKSTLVDRERKDDEIVITTPIHHVIIAPTEPIRSAAKLNELAEMIKREFDPEDILASCLRRAEDIDGYFILPEICFVKETSDGKSDIVSTFVYPNRAMASLSARYRTLRGNRLFANPQSDLDWLESRLFGRYYSTWKNITAVNGNGYSVESVLVNRTNGHGYKNGQVRGSLVLVRS